MSAPRESEVDARFRAECRAFLEKHARRRGGADDWSRGPREHTPEAEREHFERCRAWQRTLYDGGFAGIAVPRELGGRGGTAAQALIFAEEQEAFDATSGFLAAAIDLVAPALLHHGSDAQRERYLRPLLRGDEAWCQLFSEPEAGSDLAALRTRAVRDGDSFVVTGQKLWTSSAQFCDFGILLARTDPDAPKHRGITFFLLDMRSPGVSVRPLPTSTGSRHFNEVFLDAVRVPVDAVVGGIDAGWRVARETLTHESVSIGSSAHGTGDAQALVRLANERGLGGDASVRQAVADVFVRERLLALMRERLQRAIRAGRAPDLDGSVLKIFWAESRVRKDEVGLRLLGADGLLAGADAPEAGRWPEQVLDRYTGTIGGGTLEVHRNGIGERVLGLPREPRTEASAEGARSEAKPSEGRKSDPVR
ncbi:MAG TPA: acyl-CoA dehydrogenase family protein [Myxococcota bacterium]|nr:acyl-CoA dehydrogenase family protein [Myxococcota bacterium]